VVKDLRRRVVERILLAEVLVGEADHVPVGELEVVEMRVVPPREADVDGAGELLERMPRSDKEDATWCRVARRVDPRH
jgi:hypothetical protein